MLLPACSAEGDADQEPPPSPNMPQGVEFPGVEAPSAAQQALLSSTDCRTVAEGYFEALGAGDFELAARFWDDPLVDAARLDTLLRDYTTPEFTIDTVQEEGAAGSMFCTVTGALADAGVPSSPLRQGQIVLRRVNDVPGATPEQLRWHVQSSTFVEEMQRAGRGSPA